MIGVLTEPTTVGVKVAVAVGVGADVNLAVRDEGIKQLRAAPSLI